MQLDDGSQENKTDHLYRVSLKAYIENDRGEILVVKETGRNYWDLPGGGIDHDETIEQALARELKEEVNYDGAFTYEVKDIEDPKKLDNSDVRQMRIIVKVTPENWEFSRSVDSDEVAFIDPRSLKGSSIHEETLLYQYISGQNSFQNPLQ